MNEITEAFIEGQKSWDGYYNSGWKLKPENPYEKGTDKQKEWTRGWNTNFKEIK